MKGVFLCMFFLLLILNVKAQDSDTTSKRTVRHFTTTTDYLKDKVLKFVFTIDSRQSNVRNRSVGIDGIKVGMEYQKKWRFGVGFYSLIPDLTIHYINPANKIDTLKLVTHFIYASFFTEYVIFQNRKWECSLPLQYGFGRSIAERKTIDDKLLRSKIEYSNLVEASITGHYKVFNWIGIGGGAGYRYMLNRKATIRTSFDAPIYIIKVKLFLGELYKNLFPKKKVDH